MTAPRPAPEKAQPRNRALGLLWLIRRAFVGAALMLCLLAGPATAEDLLISRFFSEHAAIMLLIDPNDGQILDANHQALVFYGMTLQELQEVRIDQINAYSESEVAELRALAARGERDFFIFPHRTRHQGVKSVAVYSSSVELPSGRPALLSVIHDVTEHLIPEEDAEAYLQELERLLDDTSRDLIAAGEQRIVLQRWMLAGLLVLLLLLIWAYWSRSRMLRALEQESFASRKLEVAVNQSPASIVITDRDGTIEYVNQTCVRKTGYSREELLGQNPRLMQSGQTPKETYTDLWATITTGRTWQGRLVNRRKDGSEFVEWVLINPIVDEQQQPVRFIAVKEDITEREQLAGRLRSLERYDPLTGVANRGAFFDVLEERLGSLSGSGEQQLLVLININRFRDFNELNGHEAGDRLLQVLARRVVELVPEGTLVARLGPDEFGILPRIASNLRGQRMGAEHIPWLGRLQRALHAPFELHEQTASVRTSIGIAVCDHRCRHEDDCRPGDFMRMADSALKAAKKRGTGQPAFFDAQASEQLQQTLLLEHDLSQALQRNQLSLALQAQVGLDGTLAGVEALLRWQHHELGPVSPGRFIPLAEQSGQIISIGDWVLSQALAVLDYLQKHDPASSISVNISPVQMRQSGFVKNVRELVEQSAVRPGGLVLEITEGVFLEDPDRVQQQLKALRELGVQVSIDDFGTGYSSLTYLKRLPVDELKIDQAFVRGLPNDRSDVALVNIICNAAQELGLRIVVEGVETEQQAQFFKDQPNVLLQGYLFDRPVDQPTWFKKWLDDDPPA